MNNTAICCQTSCSQFRGCDNRWPPRPFRLKAGRYELG
jgi:hypothetical protein